MVGVRARAVGLRESGWREAKAVGENEWNDGQRSSTLAVIPRALAGTRPECA